MQKQAPSLARILIAVGFALSCFGLLLFLWITFGGPTPLKPQSYRFTADFPEAIQIAQETDVRMGGVSVGKVKKLGVPKDASGTLNATRATIELDPQFAPLPEDARAMLRQKTLLGETYVELTRGTAAGPKVPEGGHLASTQVQDQTQIDEIFNALDPQTRQNFRLWQQNAAVAGAGRGQDLNDALGNLGPFAADAASVLATVKHQNKSFGDLINHTGGFFAALSKSQDELRGAIANSNATFRAIANRDKALSEAIKVFPTFNRETKLTFDRLDSFAHNTDPLVKDLQPVARDLSPTLKSIRRLSPSLKSLFTNLDPLITVSQTGLPALDHFLMQLSPVFAALDPFLANLNPIIRYLHYYESNASDFLADPPAALAGTMNPVAGQPGPRHFLRQVSYMSAESLSVYPTRPSTNRGNGYIQPRGATGLASAFGGIFPNFDCKNTDFNGPSTDPDEDPIPANQATEENAPCFIQGPYPTVFGGGKAPQIFADP
ncbi:MAG: phospholipid/cholesterol/gamma-HCH transport system substrate-binding protein [Solirubrobacterales bacterium]|jgi:virulence factor Mce-like protein|nr:phospholipid/cholesterol/gamma-HCH transport system substrate-binding protein [Solirubrobacterales bacterium]